MMADFCFDVSGRDCIWSPIIPTAVKSLIYSICGCVYLASSYLNDGQLAVLHPPIFLARSHIRNMICLFSYWIRFL